MEAQNRLLNQDSKVNERDSGLPLMHTVAQLAKAHHCSHGLIYKILKDPDGPDFVKMGDKTLVEDGEWRRYLARRTVRKAKTGGTDAA
jgi:hypothetical protein